MDPEAEKEGEREIIILFFLHFIEEWIKFFFLFPEIEFIFIFSLLFHTLHHS